MNEHFGRERGGPPCLSLRTAEQALLGEEYIPHPPGFSSLRIAMPDKKGETARGAESGALALNLGSSWTSCEAVERSRELSNLRVLL